MNVEMLKRRYNEEKELLIRQGLLNKQFNAIEPHKDYEDEPEFMQSLFEIFFELVERELPAILLQQSSELALLKLSSLIDSGLTLGLPTFHAACRAARVEFERKNTEGGNTEGAKAEAEKTEGCAKAVGVMTEQYYLIKGKLESLLELEKEIRNAGGSIA